MTLQPVVVWLAAWPWVRQGLEKMLAKTGERELPEHFFSALQARAAFLFALDDVGFAILKRVDDCDGPVLFVWALWCEPGQAEQHERDIYASLETIAAGIGAKRIRMHSPRPGWGRLGYFTERTRIYERQL